MLEDTNSLDGAHIILNVSAHHKAQIRIQKRKIEEFPNGVP